MPQPVRYSCRYSTQEASGSQRRPPFLSPTPACRSSARSPLASRRARRRRLRRPPARALRRRHATQEAEAAQAPSCRASSCGRLRARPRKMIRWPRCARGSRPRRPRTTGCARWTWSAGTRSSSSVRWAVAPHPLRSTATPHLLWLSPHPHAARRHVSNDLHAHYPSRWSRHGCRLLAQEGAAAAQRRRSGAAHGAGGEYRRRADRLRRRQRGGLRQAKLALPEGLAVLDGSWRQHGDREARGRQGGVRHRGCGRQRRGSE